MSWSEIFKLFPEFKQHLSSSAEQAWSTEEKLTIWDTQAKGEILMFYLLSCNNHKYDFLFKR